MSIHVRDLAQLFNSLDPSPFWDRDLDRAAAEFIEEEFSEKPAGVWHLHVHTQGGATSASDLQAAVTNYYERLASSAARALREHLWMDQLAFGVGLTMFMLSVLARELLRRVMGALPQVLDEGLIILGSLALWRPTEGLVYEWLPLYRKRRLYERLAGIRVSVRGASKDGSVVHGTAAQTAPGVAQAPVETTYGMSDRAGVHYGVAKPSGGVS